jgi:N-acetyl-anhydromuramyl-L-alanine amidase AmpD
MQITETNLKFSGSLATRKSTKRAIIHHSASPDVPASTIHGWHWNQGWAGIGYHFVIRANGVIERGRPEWAIGSHSGSAGNGDSIGIVLTGNFETGKPTAAQLASLVWLLKDYLRQQYGELKIMGHKDVMATACPGRNFPWAELHARLEEDDLKQIKIDVNGKPIKNGYLIDNTAYVPARAVAEALGAKVDWNASTETVLITKGEK